MTLQIVIIGNSIQHITNVEDALRHTPYDVIARMKSTDRWHMSIASLQPDAILFSTEHPDTNDLQAIRENTHNHPVPIVLFAQHGDEETIAEATRCGVTSYVVDGLDNRRIRPILAAAITRFKEFQLLHEELKLANTRLQERKVIERAKGLLMKTRGYSENDAYTALRSQAMKKNRKLAEIAENVITTSELLS